MQAKPVTVETEMRAEGKAERREGEVWKRCWKYGEAARNMFQAHSMDMPRSRKMEYSIHEKRFLGAL